MPCVPGWGKRSERSDESGRHRPGGGERTGPGIDRCYCGVDGCPYWRPAKPSPRVDEEPQAEKKGLCVTPRVIHRLIARFIYAVVLHYRAVEMEMENDRPKSPFGFTIDR